MFHFTMTSSSAETPINGTQIKCIARLKYFMTVLVNSKDTININQFTKQSNIDTPITYQGI